MFNVDKSVNSGANVSNFTSEFGQLNISTTEYKPSDQVKLSDNEASYHWSSKVSETSLIVDASGDLPFKVVGGASNDSLCLILDVNQEIIRYEKGWLRAGDLLLEVQGEQVAGYVVHDILELIWSLVVKETPVVLKTVSEEFLSRHLTHHLGQRFQKDTVDHQLQQTIRRNIYKRALPYTTRPPREDELDGVDYKFLSVEEFLELERSGKLLEKGVYEGNYYGTPRPDVVVSHIIPWNGLPEHLYSMVNKNTTTIGSSFCSSLSPSPKSSTCSSANTTLVSPMNIRKEGAVISQTGESRDNEDALNNNDATTISSTTNQVHLPPTHHLVYPPIHPDTLCTHPGSTQDALISTTLIKGPRGLGFTIVGIEDEESGEVWLVVKNVTEGGPADVDGRLLRGDILVRVDDRDICGMSHAGVVQMFKEFQINQPIVIEVLRTANSSDLDLLDLELTDNSLEVISATGNHQIHRLGIDIVKGRSGFGFTLADRPEGQKVKQLVDQERCRGLEEGDLLLQINDQSVMGSSHSDVVNFLKACPIDRPARFLIERKVFHGDTSSTSPNVKISNVGISQYHNNNNLSSTFRNSPVSFRPLSAGPRASPLDPRHHVTSSPHHPSASSPASANRGQGMINRTHSPAFLKSPCFSSNQHTPDFIPASAFINSEQSVENFRMEMANKSMRPLDLIPHHNQRPCSPHDAPYGFRHPPAFIDPHYHLHPQYPSGSFCGEVLSINPNSCESLNLSGTYQHFHSPVLHHGAPIRSPVEGLVKFVTLKRSPNGFGFRIVGGREEGTQVSVGYIVPGGPAHRDGNLKVGQEIVLVDGKTVIGAWHREIVDLVTSAGQKGEITIGLRETDPLYYESKVTNPRQVILNRGEGDGFGFYILSPGVNIGSVIGRILENSPASRCQSLRVGDRIRAINDTPIDGMKHEQIVDLIKASGRTIRLTVLHDTPSHHCQQQVPLSLSSSSSPNPPPGHFVGDNGVAGAGCISHSGSNLSPNSSPHQSLKPFPPPPSHLPQQHHHGDVTILHVELIRGQRGFGFSIRGGQDFGMPVYILKVTEDGPARADGRLQAGDEILKINDHPTSGMLHRDAISMVQSSAHKLNLTVRRFYNLETSGDL